MVYCHERNEKIAMWAKAVRELPQECWMCKSFIEPIPYKQAEQEMRMFDLERMSSVLGRSVLQKAGLTFFERLSFNLSRFAKKIC